MADQVLTRDQLLALFPDNLLFEITAQDARDVIVSIFGYRAVSDPTPNNDEVDTAGIGAKFGVGNRWENTNAFRHWVCLRSTPGAAVWIGFTQGGLIVGIPASGVPGLDGEDGQPGPPGAPGDAGPPGPPGPSGPAGPPGARGIQGFQGPPGLAGDDGEAGPPGAPGASGSTGAAGPTGPVGPVGFSGPPGVDGEDGDSGPPGAAGPAGAAGAAGATGATGLQGLQGPPGLDGDDGFDGSPMSAILQPFDRDISYWRQVGTSPERWYLGGCLTCQFATTVFATTLAQMVLVPLPESRGGVLDRIGIQVNTTSAGRSIRLGIYQATSNTDLRPSKLVLDAGTVPVTAGVQSLAISQQLMPGTLYWLALLPDAGALSLVGINQQALWNIGGFSNGFASPVSFGNASQGFGALPDPAPTLSMQSGNPPQIGVRYSG